MPYRHAIGSVSHAFADLKDVMAKATPARSGDVLAGIAATSAAERMAARMCLAELPLARFLGEALIPYESDEVTRLIVDRHDAAAFAEVAHLTVGDFRDWLLSDLADEAALARIASGPHARDGGGRVQADAQPGPDPRREQVPRRHAIPRHHRPAGAALGAAAAEPSDRRARQASPPRCSTACSTAPATR